MLKVTFKITKSLPVRGVANTSVGRILLIILNVTSKVILLKGLEVTRSVNVYSAQKVVLIIQHINHLLCAVW